MVAAAVAAMPAERTCKCGSALAHAIITDRKLVPAATRQKLGSADWQVLRVTTSLASCSRAACAGARRASCPRRCWRRTRAAARCSASFVEGLADRFEPALVRRLRPPVLAGVAAPSRAWTRRRSWRATSACRAARRVGRAACRVRALPRHPGRGRGGDERPARRRQTPLPGRRNPLRRPAKNCKVPPTPSPSPPRARARGRRGVGPAVF